MYATSLQAIILETCCEFIFQLENHVFGLFFERGEIGAGSTPDECPSHSENFLASLFYAKREKHNSDGKREAMRIKRPKNSFILFSMGQRKQLLKYVWIDVRLCVFVREHYLTLLNSCIGTTLLSTTTK